MKKLFIVRKYVMADDAAQALRLEKGIGAHEVFLDDDWAKSIKSLPPEKDTSVGF